MKIISLEAEATGAQPSLIHLSEDGQGLALGASAPAGALAKVLTDEQASLDLILLPSPHNRDGFRAGEWSTRWKCPVWVHPSWPIQQMSLKAWADRQGFCGVKLVGAPHILKEGLLACRGWQALVKQEDGELSVRVKTHEN